MCIQVLEFKKIKMFPSVHAHEKKATLVSSHKAVNQRWNIQLEITIATAKGSAAFQSLRYKMINNGNVCIMSLKF